MKGRTNVGGGKPEEEKTVTAGTSVIEVLPSSGKTIKKVTVNPTPSQSKSVTPNESAQTVRPDSGKLLSSVSVGAIQTEEKTVTAGTSTKVVTPSGGKTIKKVTVNPTPSQSKTVTPSTSQQTVSPDSGKLLSRVIVNGDSDLVAENIRKDIDIFGVVGTLVEGVAGIDFGEVTLASASSSVTVSHNLGVVPSWVALIPKSLATANNSSLFNINGKAGYSAMYSSSAIQLKSAANTLSAEEITFAANSTSYPFRATGYYWFALV